VWSKEFSERLEEKVIEAVHLYSKDNYLLGYFVDNEMPWGNMRLFDAALECAGRDAWERMVRELMIDIPNFNAATGLSCNHWQEIRNIQTSDITQAVQPLINTFEEHYALQYFSTVRTILKRHDPHHLYLGCRFVRKPPHVGIIKAAGKYCDVLSVNCYSVTPAEDEFGYWHSVSNRPIMIGEFHLPLASERQLPPLYAAFTEEERQSAVFNFLQTWAMRSYSLGAHWYQHADQPLMGRPTDGENQTVGLVSITDDPHLDIEQAFTKASKLIYEWHSVRNVSTSVSGRHNIRFH